MERQNVLVRMQQALAKQLNEMIHLPRFIVLLLGDDFEKITTGMTSHELTELFIRWLISKIVVCVECHKAKMPDNSEQLNQNIW